MHSISANRGVLRPCTCTKHRCQGISSTTPSTEATPNRCHPVPWTPCNVQRGPCFPSPKTEQPERLHPSYVRRNLQLARSPQPTPVSYRHRCLAPIFLNYSHPHTASCRQPPSSIIFHPADHRSHFARLLVFVATLFLGKKNRSQLCSQTVARRSSNDGVTSPRCLHRVPFTQRCAQRLSV
ncbi:hypothetical protein I3842_03G190100 [Carya illinoinensis]|uniref:Uncharacterized protein n=1 Tax=Carya illinoinensis TaxID=32201 RepID=A0A922K0S5_CARIL|nr:hypothetical protein I3842_03G190100 [Carya illinoinensis]